MHWSSKPAGALEFDAWRSAELSADLYEALIDIVEDSLHMPPPSQAGSRSKRSSPRTRHPTPAKAPKLSTSSELWPRRRILIDHRFQLRAIELREFKSIRDQRVDLGPLTAVVGALNSAGKSTLLQAILALAQAVRSEGATSEFPLNGSLIRRARSRRLATTWPKARDDHRSRSSSNSSTTPL